MHLWLCKAADVSSVDRCGETTEETIDVSDLNFAILNACGDVADLDNAEC